MEFRRDMDDSTSTQYRKLESNFCKLQIEKNELHDKYIEAQNQISMLYQKLKEVDVTAYERKIVELLNEIHELEYRLAQSPIDNSKKLSKIVVHAITTIEGFTRSPLTGALISSPIMTPGYR